MLFETKKFLKLNDDLILTKADKGNTTVALKKTDYTAKMRDLLNDGNTYLEVFSDPIKRVTKDLNTLIKRWKHNEYITEGQYGFLNCTDGIIPHAYGLPKIHKNNIPLRIIVSSINSPLHNIGRFLHKIIFDNVPKSNSYIKNSFDLVNKLSGIHVEEHFELISLDVISLFTNVPSELALLSISKRWHFISEHIDIPIDEFLLAVQFVLDSTFFKSNNHYYKQTFGTPMGSPLSPVIADIVLQDLEEKALAQLPFKVPFYFRYVDDILTAVPRSFVNLTLQTFNSFHKRLQFTYEVGINNNINFLDTNIKIDNGIIEFDWFHKPTYSGRYLSFYSQHPLCHKVGMILGLVDRMFLLSHPKHHQKNIIFIIKILLNNGYPLDFIFKYINMRLRKLINNSRIDDLIKSKIVGESNQEKEKNMEGFFVLPYLEGFSESISSMVKKCFNIRPAYRGLNNLSNFIKPQKNPLHKSSVNNVVYKISCLDCDASYVGQTKRKLITRINEHRRLNLQNGGEKNESVVSMHKKLGHEFDWENTQILDRERSLSRRLTSEMFHIKLQKNGINKQDDTINLNSIYLPIIDNLV